MRRIAALAAIIFGLTMVVAVPAVITASPASALTCDASHHVETDGTGQQFCAQNSGTGGGASTPAMMSCWNGTSVPVTSACPAAPSTPQPPAAGCGANMMWSGSACVPSTYTPTTTSVTCPDGTSHPTGFVCPTTNTGSGAGSGATITCPDGSVHGTPFTCPTTSGNTGTGTYTNPTTALCADKITLVSQGCPTTSVGGSTGSGGNALTIKCADGSYRNTAIECPGGATSSSATSSGATGGMSSGTSGSSGTSIYCNDGITMVITGCTGSAGGVPAGSTLGTPAEQQQKCANAGWTWTGTSCIAPVVAAGSGNTGTSGGTSNGAAGSSTGSASAGSVDPCKASADYSKCVASINAAVASCPAGFFYDQGIQGCKATTASSATIRCADGSLKVTAIECSTVGGAVGSAVASATGNTCAAGYAPNSTGFCVPLTQLSNSTNTSGFVDCTSGANQTNASCAKTSTNTTAVAGSSGGACSNGWVKSSTGSCIAPVVATAAGASLGGSCLDGYVATSTGVCMPKGYDGGANIPSNKNSGPIVTSIDPCRVTPVPPSCIASGAVTVSANTVVQAQTARYGPSAPAPSAGGAPGAPQGGDDGRVASQFTAPPAKNGKPAAPVLIFNVLGSDNKALTDSNGKELTTKPAVKSGNTVFVDKSGSPVITAPTLDPSGRPVTGPDGAVLYTRLMTFAGQEAVTDSSGRAVTATPLLNGSGKALTAPNGKVVYAPPVLDVKGNIILNSYGSPVLAQPLSDATGAIATGPNGEPVVVQPMVAEGGKAILKNGQPIYVGAAGTQALTAKNESIKTAFGQTITFANSGTLADEGGNAVLGPDGRPVILSAAGVPIAANGAALLDKNGKPIRVTADGGVTDSSGRPILGADNKQITLGAAEVATVLKAGKSVIKSTDGKTVTVALNGQLVDTAGNPVLAAGNKAIFIDPKTKTFKDASGKAVAVSKTGVISAKSAPLAYQTGAIDAA